MQSAKREKSEFQVFSGEVFSRRGQISSGGSKFSDYQLKYQVHAK
jgi:hypothetical protein